jgi:hypothetical protein
MRGCRQRKEHQRSEPSIHFLIYVIKTFVKEGGSVCRGGGGGDIPVQTFFISHLPSIFLTSSQSNCDHEIERVDGESPEADLGFFVR